MKTITLEEFLQLSVPERIRIVEAIRDCIADAPQALKLSDEQKVELQPLILRPDAETDSWRSGTLVPVTSWRMAESEHPF